MAEEPAAAPAAEERDMDTLSVVDERTGVPTFLDNAGILRYESEWEGSKYRLGSKNCVHFAAALYECSTKGTAAADKKGFPKNLNKLAGSFAAVCNLPLGVSHLSQSRSLQQGGTPGGPGAGRQAGQNPGGYVAQHARRSARDDTLDNSHAARAQRELARLVNPRRDQAPTGITGSDRATAAMGVGVGNTGGAAGEAVEHELLEPREMALLLDPIYGGERAHTTLVYSQWAESASVDSSASELQLNDLNDEDASTSEVGEEEDREAAAELARLDSLRMSMYSGATATRRMPPLTPSHANMQSPRALNVASLNQRQRTTGGAGSNGMQSGAPPALNHMGDSSPLVIGRVLARPAILSGGGKYASGTSTAKCHASSSSSAPQALSACGGRDHEVSTTWRWDGQRTQEQDLAAPPGVEAPTGATGVAAARRLSTQSTASSDAGANLVISNWAKRAEMLQGQKSSANRNAQAGRVYGPRQVATTPGVGPVAQAKRQ